MRSVDNQLLEILRREGLVGAAQLEQILAQRRSSGATLATLLVDEGLVQEDDLFFLLSRHLGVPTIPAERLIHLVLTPDLRRRIPRALAQARAVLPLDLDPQQRCLSVAMFDPSDDATVSVLRELAGVDSVSTYLARRSVILETIEAIYEEGGDDRLGDAKATGRRAGLGTPSELADPLEEAETGVELIPGKVSLDASLAREISQLPGEPQRRFGKPTRPAPVSDGAQRTMPKKLRVTGPPAPPGRLSEDNHARAASPDEVPGVSSSSRTLKMKVPRGFLEEASDEAVEQQDSEPTKARRDLSPSARSAAAPRSATAAGQKAGQPPAGAEIGQRGRARLDPASERDETVRVADALDALHRELFAALAALATLLEQRVRGDDLRRSSEYRQLTTLLAQELGLGEPQVARLGLAAQLYGLDEALRCEAGSQMRADVGAVFSVHPSAPGGLTGKLRRMGRRALAASDARGTETLSGASLIQLVATYVELRDRVGGEVDPDQLSDLLGESGSQPALVIALRRVLKREAKAGTDDDAAEEKS